MIKTSIEEKPIPNEYPCLMSCDDGNEIILFSSKSIGTVIHIIDAKRAQAKSRSIGYHSEDWRMSRFRPFVGTVNITG